MWSQSFDFNMVSAISMVYNSGFVWGDDNIVVCSSLYLREHFAAEQKPSLHRTGAGRNV